MNIIRALFGKLPSAGEVYRKDDKDPFNLIYFAVTDAKDGYVQYRQVSSYKGKWVTSGMLLSEPRWSFHLSNIKCSEADASSIRDFVSKLGN